MADKRRRPADKQRQTTKRQTTKQRPAGKQRGRRKREAAVRLGKRPHRRVSRTPSQGNETPTITARAAVIDGSGRSTGQITLSVFGAPG
jgi:hypothetical protein